MNLHNALISKSSAPDSLWGLLEVHHVVVGIVMGTDPAECPLIERALEDEGHAALQILSGVIAYLFEVKHARTEWEDADPIWLEQVIEWTNACLSEKNDEELNGLLREVGGVCV